MGISKRFASEEYVTESVTAVEERVTTLETETSELQQTVNDLKENGTGGGTSVVNTDYKWIKSGQMRTPVRDFQGWAHCVQYDKELGKAVGIVISGNGSHSNSAPLYRVTIENNGYMSPYEEMVFNYPSSDSEPTGYIGSFLILNDGTYWCCDYRQRIFTSSDKGYTWDFVTQLALNGRSTYNNDSLFGVTVLSNGRFVGGNIGNVASETYYSDNGVDWTTVVMDKSQLGQQTYPEGNYVPFEPFFIDCGNGKVIQYARASMNAFKTLAEGNWTKQEGAVYSVSTDYGTTWTPWKWSESIVDMTANNGKVVVIGDVVHCVYGSRYIGYTDEYGNTPFFTLRYTHTTLEKVLNDEWEEAIVIDVGHWDEATASLKADCGYPSIWKDENNNLFAVYYDSAENGLPYGANWRLILANPYVQKKAVEDSGSGSKNVAYSQAQVDLIISGLMTKINELYMLVGQMPEDGGNLDGSQPVFNGLVEWFESGDSTQWSEDGTIKSKANSGYTASNVGDGNGNAYATIKNHVPNTFAQNMSSGYLKINASLTDYGITNACTIEFVMDMASNQSWNVLAKTGTYSPFTFNFSNSNQFSGAYDMTACHVAVVFTLEDTKIYHNGALTDTKSALTESVFAESSPVLIPFNGGCGGFRMYNRALTADEVKNNYQYASALTEIGSNSFA